METQGRGFRTVADRAGERRSSRAVARGVGGCAGRTLAAAVAWLACAVAVAQVPQQIPYRGHLELAGGPVTNQGVAMRFELFGASSGGNPLWWEEQLVSVLDGNFSVALGSANAIEARHFAQPSLYLQISVNGQALQGRQRLLTVPYAHYAAASSAVPVGTIIAFAGATPPPGWLPCNAEAFDPAAYPALDAVLAAQYGRDPARSNWPRVPDLRSRFPVGAGIGPGLTPRGLGDAGGAEAYALSTDQLPPHTHAVSDPGHAHAHRYGFMTSNLAGMWHTDSPQGVASGLDHPTVGAGAIQGSATGISVLSAGAGAAHPSTPPYLGVNWIIKAVP